jgi:hypothetical protein
MECEETGNGYSNASFGKVSTMAPTFAGCARLFKDDEQLNFLDWRDTAAHRNTLWGQVCMSTEKGAGLYFK